jgi:nicotinamide-nucleotide amidase
MELVNFEPAVLSLAGALRARGWRLATAESCTGGLIAAACTSVAGSSDWFERGFITYSNEAKTTLLGVDPVLLKTQGAVSEAVALAMALGTLQRAPVQLAVSVTGIAGPGGAVPGKPVGTVWMAVAWLVTACRRPGTQGATELPGDRTAVRHLTVAAALQALLGCCEGRSGLIQAGRLRRPGLRSAVRRPRPRPCR